MAPPLASKKRKTESAPPIDKLLLPAIGIGLALLAYQFFKGIKAEIPRVNLLDETELRQVFFGEGGSDKSYCVLCHDESSLLPLSSVFLDAHGEGKSPAEFRVVDCQFVLPSSEKTIAERFKLDLTQRPTIFVSGKVGEPKQIPTKHLKTGKMLTKVLRNLLERRAAKIDTTQDLRTKCLDKDICALLLKGSKQAPGYVKSAMNKLLTEFPSVAFAFVDSTVLYVLNVEEYLPELEDEQPRFVVFRKVSGGGESKDRLKTSLAALPTNGVAYGPMSNLVASVVQQSQVMTKVPVLPVIKTRTKKLEQEERNKRARKLEQQRRQAEQRANGGRSSSSSSSSSSSGDSGDFQTNDGSRDGRRAERERRRAEHMAQNNVREKTPEEIAEMERQRRIRMDEEAARWNIAPEDAPEEGEAFVDEDNLDDIMGGDDSDKDEEHRDKKEKTRDADEENGDDVLDLD